MTAYDRAAARWDGVAKPLGSFGLLEEAVCRLAAVQGTDDVDISKRTAVVMCADHGVTAHGVSQCGNSDECSKVTAVCAREIAEGRSNINAVAEQFGADVIAVDIGMARDVKCERLVNKKIAYGTADFTRGAAMTLRQAERAVAVGVDMAGELKAGGTQVIITGEMGIGNTTSAAAVAAVLTGLSPEEVTGRGAGLSDEGLKRKISAVKRCIAVGTPDPDDPWDVLHKAGGFELAGMAGLFLGGAEHGIAVVIDGVISATAAALAYRIDPKCGEYMFASHCSGEPAAEKLLALCGQTPLINAGLRLGEGTGGVLLLPLLDGAIALYRRSHTFTAAGLEPYYRS